MLMVFFVFIKKNPPRHNDPCFVVYLFLQTHLFRDFVLTSYVFIVTKFAAIRVDKRNRYVAATSKPPVASSLVGEYTRYTQPPIPRVTIYNMATQKNKKNYLYINYVLYIYIYFSYINIIIIII